MKKFLTFFLIFSFITLPTNAIDLDTSVDDEIRQNYKSNELVDKELPELPKILNSSQASSKADTQEIIKQKTAQATFRGNIKKGTKISVINDNSINDGLKKGTKVTFHSKSPVYSKGITIPAGTKFYAEIIDAHPPQITCNGGLVELQVHSIVINHSVTPINGYITRANSKKIFLNNIKGKRTYLKTLWAKTGFGRNLFNKMLTLTINLGGDGSTLILSPFPAAYGTLVLGLNTISSPIIAFFSKGGRVNIPVGTDFVIKLKDDVGLFY